MKTFTFLDGAKATNVFVAENLTIMENLTFFTLDERLENIDALFNLLIYIVLFHQYLHTIIIVFTPKYISSCKALFI